MKQAHLKKRKIKVVLGNGHLTDVTRIQKTTTAARLVSLIHLFLAARFHVESGTREE